MVDAHKRWPGQPQAWANSPWHESCLRFVLTVKKRRPKDSPRLAAAASWTALVAATLGFSSVNLVRAEIASSQIGTSGAYRLVVQSYAPESLAADERPGTFARPLSSMQRAVTAEELERGIAVDLVQIDAAAGSAVVVAWVEPGEPDLEFDALRARPSPGAHYGTGSPGARVVLKKTV